MEGARVASASESDASARCHERWPRERWQRAVRPGAALSRVLFLPESPVCVSSIAFGANHAKQFFDHL